MQLISPNLPALHQDFLIASLDSITSKVSAADFSWTRYELNNPETFDPVRSAQVRTTCERCTERAKAEAKAYGRRIPIPDYGLTWYYIPLPPSVLEINAKSKRIGYLVAKCLGCATIAWIAIDQREPTQRPQVP